MSTKFTLNPDAKVFYPSRSAGPLRGGHTADVVRVSFSEGPRASFAVDESTKFTLNPDAKVFYPSRSAGPLRGGHTADVVRVSFSEGPRASFAVDESTKKKSVQFDESVDVRRFTSDSPCVVETVETLCVYDLRRLGIAMHRRLTNRDCDVTYDTFEMIGYLRSILEKFDDGADVVVFNAGGRLPRSFESKLREFLDLLE